jgi:hypothetical protein
VHYTVQQIICTAILVLAVLIGLSGELWNLMSKTKMHVLLPFVVGGAVAVSHLVLVPVGEHAVYILARCSCTCCMYINLSHLLCSRQAAANVY